MKLRKAAVISLVFSAALLIGCSEPKVPETDAPETTTEVVAEESSSEREEITLGGVDDILEDSTEAVTPEDTPEAATPEETSEEVTEVQTTPEETTEAVVFTEVNEKVYCTESSVNVRRAPGTHGEKAGQLARGDEVTRTGIGDNGWSRVLYKNEVCYVHGDFLSMEKPKALEVSLPPEGIPGTGIFHQGTNGILVAIDAGHQRRGNNDKEPNGPGSTEMKNKVSYGTAGVSTGVAEYVVNLSVSLQLRDALLAEGYSVLMIRETHDVDISNAERAILANEQGADIFLRIHCNGSSNAKTRGTETIAPSKKNSYCSEIAPESQRLSQLLVDAMCDATGFKNRGVIAMDNMTGINWCEIPVSIVEMGYMSNAEEDEALVSAEVQAKMVQGMVDGVNAYFGR